MTSAPQAAQRIVVAFDPHAPQRAALDLGVRLAMARAQVLHALYVEDLEALNLGEFAWVREIATATADTRPMRRQAVERHYRSRGAEAQALFAAAASRASGARFETVRGRLLDELKRFGAEAAGVLIDWPKAGLSVHLRGSGLLRALLELRAPVVGLVASPPPEASRVLVVPRGQASGLVAELAALLGAPSRGGPPEGSPPRVAAPLACEGHRPTADALIERLRRERAGTLLLERGATDDDAALLAELLRRWSGSLLIVQ
jgi:nucleotide-binding universal stress UspA family protein